MSDEDKQYCDHCAVVLEGREFVPVRELPVNVSSALEGESAVLCPRCYQAVLRCSRKVDEAFGELEQAAFGGD